MCKNAFALRFRIFSSSLSKTALNTAMWWLRSIKTKIYTLDSIQSVRQRGKNIGWSTTRFHPVIWRIFVSIFSNKLFASEMIQKYFVVMTILLISENDCAKTLSSMARKTLSKQLVKKWWNCQTCVVYLFRFFLLPLCHRWRWRR